MNWAVDYGYIWFANVRMKGEKNMDNLLGVVQNIVSVGEGEYRVTFRAYVEEEMEARMLEMAEAHSRLYSMIAKIGEQDYTFVAEGELSDCVSVYKDNETVETVEEGDREKWKIGVLANDIVSSLADREMFTPVGVEEE